MLKKILSKKIILKNKNLLLPFFMLFSGMMNITTSQATENQLITQEITPKGRLTFVPVEKQEAECELLISFLKDKIQENEMTRMMLEESLAKGNLKIALMANDSFTSMGNYTPTERCIRIRVKDYMEVAGATSPFKLMFKDMHQNNILKVCIFELGNSLNEEAIDINMRPYQFPDAHSYALAKEKAEYNTSVMAEKAYAHGRAMNGWNSSVFNPRDMELEKKTYESADNSHFQFYMSQYNEDRVLNKVRYYISHFFKK